MSDLYTAALREAQGELADIQPKIDSLTMRKRTLESLVAQLQAITGLSNGYPVYGSIKMLPQDFISSPPTMSLMGTGNDDSSTEPASYLWQQIREAMKGKNAWTLSEAGTSVEQMFKIDLGQHRTQKVRNSLIRHEEAFERLPDGRYTNR